MGPYVGCFHGSRDEAHYDVFLLGKPHPLALGFSIQNLAYTKPSGLSKNEVPKFHVHF